MSDRRAFLGGLLGIIASPAIVRASSLMAIKPIESDLIVGYYKYAGESALHRTPYTVPLLLMEAMRSWQADYGEIPNAWDNMFS